MGKNGKNNRIIERVPVKIVFRKWFRHRLHHHHQHHDRTNATNEWGWMIKFTLINEATSESTARRRQGTCWTRFRKMGATMPKQKKHRGGLTLCSAFPPPVNCWTSVGAGTRVGNKLGTTSDSLGKLELEFSWLRGKSGDSFWGSSPSSFTGNVCEWIRGRGRGE